VVKEIHYVTLYSTFRMYSEVVCSLPLQVLCSWIHRLYSARALDFLLLDSLFKFPSKPLFFISTFQWLPYSLSESRLIILLIFFHLPQSTIVLFYLIIHAQWKVFWSIDLLFLIPFNCHYYLQPYLAFSLPL